MTYSDVLFDADWPVLVVAVLVVTPLALCLPGRSLPFRRRMPPVHAILPP